MPQTSSYKIGNIIRKNLSCFSELNSSSLIERYIIIEKEKQKYYSKDIITEYLNDLKEIGFKFEMSKVKDDIYLKIENETKHKNIAFGMLVRYLWEGLYQQDYSDRFYIILNHYLEIKKVCINHNKLELMCLAHNIAYVKNKSELSYFNSNHCLSNNTGCKIVSSINNIQNHVNNTFLKTLNLKEIKYIEYNVFNTKSDYEKLLELLKN